MVRDFFFFFSSRRRHTRCSRDWSSDVCSSDLDNTRRPAGQAGAPRVRRDRGPDAGHFTAGAVDFDWERGGEGKRGEFRGCRVIKKKKQKNQHEETAAY